MIYQGLTKIGTNSGIHIMDLCFLRTFVNFLTAIFTVTYHNKKPFIDVPKEHRFLVFVRSIVGLLGFNTFVYACKVLPIFVISIIFNTAPFWASFLSYFFLNEKVTKSELIGICGCFTGIVILALHKKQVAEAAALENSTIEEMTN